MASFKEIAVIKHPKSHQDFYVKYVYRVLNIPFTWLFINLGISANLATFIGMLNDWLAAYFVYTSNWIWAAILVQMGILLDTVDGEIARWNIYKNKITSPKKFGKYLDEVLGIVGLTPVIFMIAYINDAVWWGFFAAMAVFMMNLTSSAGAHLFPEVKGTVEVRRKFLGKLADPLAFGMTAQRAVITLAALNVYPIFFLGVMAVVGNIYWCMRFFLFKNY